MVLNGMAGSSHLLTVIFSAMRDRMGVTEMGRKSPRESGLVTLGTGVTSAIFQYLEISGARFMTKMQRLH